MRKKTSILAEILNIALLSSFAIFFTSCDESITQNNKTTKKNFPSQIVHHAKIIQRDSGQIKLRAYAPLLESYDLLDTPYVEARKGINIEYFDLKKSKKPGKISADYAKMIERKKMYEAKGNVRVLTQEGQLFTMQSVYWNQEKKIIYTQDTVYITDKDGSRLVATKGMHAKDDFSEYTFHNTTGDFSTQQIPNQNK